jgi:hypothetical protein
LVSIAASTAPTGCCVVRGGRDPGIEGDLFFGSWGRRDLRRVAFHSGSRTTVDSVSIFHVFSTPHRVTDVTMGPDRVLWVSTADFTEPGAIWRFEPPAPLDVPPAADGPVFAARPNPFTGSIRLGLGSVPDFDDVEIVDLGGRVVRRWTQPDAEVIWDGRDRRGRFVEPGVYFARATAGETRVTKRLVRIR